MRGWWWVVLLAAPLAVPAAAQRGAAARCGTARADSLAADSGVAVVVRASVGAQELTFRAAPHADVSLPGCAPGQGVRLLERSNLPAQPQPGVTYRDVRVSVEILGRLDAACIAALAGDSTAARGLFASGCALRPRADTAATAPAGAVAP